jgi:predicted adenine nucleotide alpha hydrolase (AANH) superfamily ATPase
MAWMACAPTNHVKLKEIKMCDTFYYFNKNIQQTPAYEVTSIYERRHLLPLQDPIHVI